MSILSNQFDDIMLSSDRNEETLETKYVASIPVLIIRRILYQIITIICFIMSDACIIN